MTRLVLQVLWPAFLMAGVLEMLVFAVVDPGEIHGLGGASLEWPLQAVYTITFLMFWVVVAAAGAITAMLIRTSPAVDHDSLS